MLKRIMTKKVSRIFFTIGFVITLSLGLHGCSLAPTKTTQTTPVNSAPVDALIAEQATATVGRPADAEFSYTAEAEGQSALDLLKKNTEVQMKEYEFGTFIEGINGVLGDEKRYWAFYVNREYAKESADKTILQKGDTATFRLETIEAFPTQASEK